MSQAYLVLGAGILGVAAAAVVLYAVFARREALKMPGLTVMMIMLGLQQISRGERWVVYVEFCAAAVGIISMVVHRRRGRSL